MALKPNYVVYITLLYGFLSTLIDGLCADGVLDEMAVAGLKPNVVIYTALVSGYCGKGRFEDACEVFKRMVEGGITPNVYS
ncbi:hypothetical protein ACLOJK_002239 [Asimina triloba]